MNIFLQAAAAVFTPSALFFMLVGTFFGILCGAMPGLSAVMAVSILLPFTFSLKGTGIMMLLGTFCGAIYGGSITAILINTPGTANSAATCLDGYPMAHRLGQPGRALSISTMASTFGGMFSACALLFTAPLLSKVALNFGVVEMFALGVFGLSIVTAVSSHSIIKGLLGAVLGLLLGTVGMDATSATFRFTFGTTYLIGGVQFVALLIGLFALSQCFMTAESSLKEMHRAKQQKLDQILPSKKDIKKTAPTILVSSVIGTIIGAIPGHRRRYCFLDQLQRGKAVVQASGGVWKRRTGGHCGTGSLQQRRLGRRYDSAADAGHPRRLRHRHYAGRADDARNYPWTAAIQHTDCEGLYHHYFPVCGKYHDVPAWLRRNPRLCQDQHDPHEVAESHCVYVLRRGNFCNQQQYL